MLRQRLMLHLHYGQLLLLREGLSLVIVVAGLVHELDWRVLDGGRRAGLELHVSQHSVHQLDVLALAGHEVAALGVGVGDHVLVSQQSVYVTAGGGGGRDLDIL